MAEIIEYRKERLMPEYEQMKRIKLFSDEEIRNLKTQREAFEYKLGKPQKALKDYILYVHFERSLLLLLHERRKKLGITQKKGSIESKIGNRIVHLYSQAINHFPQKIHIWDEFIKFCSLSRKTSEVPIVLDKMVKLHGEKPEVWLRGFLWSYNEGKDIVRAKHFLMRGLQRHPKCEELYQSFISLELGEGSKLCTDVVLMDSTQSQQSLALERTKIIYESSKQELLLNVDYLKSIKQIVQAFPFAQDLYEIVCQDIEDFNSE